MKLQSVGFHHLLRSSGFLILLSAVLGQGQQVPSRPRQFAPGTLSRLEELPASRLRSRLDRLPAAARQRALARLRSFHFTELDLESLEADSDGEVFYADNFSNDPAAAPRVDPEPAIGEASVAVSPFPASLIFHSKPGAPNILYLNFSGENVSGTSWNTEGRTVIPAVAFSTDTDYSAFSDAEQAIIKRVWQRVAEDYSPFNIDVTTERPATFGTRAAHAVITRSTDANGIDNPSSSAGGVAYVNVFGNSNYGTYRPGWIYFDNLGGSQSSIAEAVSHEIGHNLGLSHDGKTDGTEYYGGHGSGDTSWGPIMGSVSSRNVTQWSRGDYYLANNTQDDLATIAGKIAYRTDDRGDTPGAATPLVITGGTNVVSTTPENDPTNLNPANKGILEHNTDVDVFSFICGNGPINLSVKPWISPAGSRGGNLDVLAELHDASGALILSSNPASQTTAQIQTTLVQGTYYLYVRNTGVGDPLSSTPTGYTSYGSIGQYFITGYVTASGTGSSSVRLTAMVNNPSWGVVSPTNATYTAGSSVQVVATPANYFRFVRWTNGAAGTSNPLTLVLNTNMSIQAVFAEILTVSHPTPYWWLASYGYSSNFETAVNATGANGIPLWQSYIAGLNPNDPSSQLRLSLARGVNGVPNVLNWSTVSGRVYTLWYSTNLAAGFARVPGASNLPSSVRTFTHALNPVPRAVFYRIEAGRL
jgi:hypothetical protein